DVRVCVVTRGAEGVYAFARTGEECWVGGMPVKVVDTCGAGDAFTAGFVSRYLEEAGLEECCVYGNALGAAVAGTAGGMTAIEPGKLESLLHEGTGQPP